MESSPQYNQILTPFLSHSRPAAQCQSASVIGQSLITYLGVQVVKHYTPLHETIWQLCHHLCPVSVHSPRVGSQYQSVIVISQVTLSRPYNSWSVQFDRIFFFWEPALSSRVEVKRNANQELDNMAAGGEPGDNSEVKVFSCVRLLIEEDMDWSNQCCTAAHTKISAWPGFFFIFYFPSVHTKATALAGPSWNQAIVDGFGPAWGLNRPKPPQPKPQLWGQAGPEQPYYHVAFWLVICQKPKTPKAWWK